MCGEVFGLRLLLLIDEMCQLKFAANGKRSSSDSEGHRKGLPWSDSCCPLVRRIRREYLAGKWGKLNLLVGLDHIDRNEQVATDSAWLVGLIRYGDKSSEFLLIGWIQSQTL